MNKVLIVEDEKMIRKGIVAMLKRVMIPIGEIIECRNGEEALQVLYKTKIDLVITDIRMPKMDGVTLVKKIQELSEKPYILVVSGYDDFYYAVEVLRQGVQDYLLKPIEREKFSKAILKIQQLVETNLEKKEEIRKIGSQQLKYLLLNKEIKDSEIESIKKQFSNFFSDQSYYMCCTKKSQIFLDETDSIFVLDDLNGQTFLLIESNQLEGFMKKNLLGVGIGISNIHRTIEEIKIAYEEALKSREEAFVKCISIYYYENWYQNYESWNQNYELIPDDFAEQFVQLFGTQKVEEGLTKFSNIRFKAKMNKISATSFLELTRIILNNLIKNYERMIEFDMQEFQTLNEPLAYENADSYYLLLENWIRKMQQLIMDEFDDYKNKEKINIAIQYIREHYKNDLNMAVVSNYISMNYSLFSLSFKQYTGMNFVNYLKKIRVDEAKRLLEETDEKIIGISQMVGYENEKHFMKIFKSVCGVSPSEYRKNMLFKK